jgi:ATP-dependent Clp protease adapter protein ClpS
VNTEAFFVVGAFMVLVGVPLLGFGFLLGRWLRPKRAATTLVALRAPAGNGYFKVMEIGGVALRVHGSLPAVGLLAAICAGFQLNDPAYFYVSYLILVGLHEFGHVAAARFLGLGAFSVEISAFGGQCRFSRIPSTVKDTFLVYSAGIFAQLVLLILTLLHLAAFGQPTTRFGSWLALTFTLVNLVIIAINFLPMGKPHIAATDGYVLWKLLLHVWKKEPHPLAVLTAPSPIFSPDTRLISLEGFLPGNFVVGVEILNDNTTPMEFVVGTLMKHLDLERNSAVELMLAIHQKGGLLVPLPTMEKAEAVAAGVAMDAREHGQSLVCRAVDARQPASGGDSALIPAAP